MKSDTKKSWKTNSAKELLRTHLFSVQEEELVCPRNGRKGKFLIFQFGDWVNVIARTKLGQIVMIKQFRHGNKRFELEIPGGLIDKSDNGPVSAGMRELLEETGYTGKSPVLLGSVYPNPAIQNNLCHTIFVDDVVYTGNSSQEDCEDIETILVDENEIENLIYDGTIRHSLVMNAFQIYFLKKRRGEI